MCRKKNDRDLKKKKIHKPTWEIKDFNTPMCTLKAKILPLKLSPAKKSQGSLESN